MNEFSVMTYLLETVEQEARNHAAGRVLAINLVVGERSSIMDDSLSFYFDLLTPGTLAEGARLHTRRVPSQFTCLACGATYSAGEDFRCPNCQGIGRISDAGSEFYIESIEIERDDRSLVQNRRRDGNLDRLVVGGPLAGRILHVAR